MIRMLVAFAGLAIACLAAARVKEAPARGAAPAPAVAAEVAPARRADGRTARVVVIPVREEISSPVLYILRRGLKSASKDDWVVLDMKTPGGSVGTMLEIAEALGKFEGRKVTFINDEALSAGALIASVTDEIYFAPRAVMGAAAVITSDGQDLQKTLKEKIDSVLLAKVRTWAEGKGRYRADALTAMVDSDFEFKIGDTVIKPKGKLLSVTAKEAEAQYGTPPEALLSRGTYPTVEALLNATFGAGNYRVDPLQVTWSEQLAQWLQKISPVLLGLGLLLLFIEFKTPGFGAFGVSGAVLLLIVFASSYVAGLSGHEPAVFFCIGLLLVLVEVFFFPGIVVMLLTGLLLMLGSLVWAMADLWPAQPISISGDGLSVFVGPMGNLALGLMIAIGGGIVLLRFLPRSWIWGRMVLEAAIDSNSQAARPVAEGLDPLIGQEGRATTDMFPTGEVEVGGTRYSARVEVGSVKAGTAVRIVGRSSFDLLVEESTQ